SLLFGTLLKRIVVISKAEMRKMRLVRHAEGGALLCRFLGFLRALVCVDACLGVGYSSVAAERFGFLPCVWLGLGLLVWWWFENSRACLYYFFIVNDCQSIACLLVFWWVPERWLNGDGVLCERSFFLIKDFSRLFCFESLFFGLSS
ncbi:hypothetical protein, partial [Bifidobacterium myosotis]|uniref:hypothetical protein n=1 Tax=Bifidobacterium myosotis TaxID=1630166 RepID=UPI001B80BC5E